VMADTTPVRFHGVLIGPRVSGGAG
jgi:hypothetical protein